MTRSITLLLSIVGLIGLGSPELARADTGPDATDTGLDTTPSDTATDIMDASRDTGIVSDGVASDASLDGGTSDVRGDGGVDDGGEVEDGTADAMPPRDVLRDSTGDTESDGARDVSRDTTSDGSMRDVDTIEDTTGSDTDAEPPGDVVDGADARDARATADFFGRVELQSRADAADVTIVLRRAAENGEGDEVARRTTGAEGRFRFDDLALGRYQIELSRSGFVSMGETFELRGDREEVYRLFRDQAVDIRVRALFSENVDPPSTVRFELEGPRGTIEPDEPIDVEQREAVWTRRELGVGRWTIRASAEGFETVVFGFDVRGTDEARRQLSVRLNMLSQSREPVSVREESGCSCGNNRQRRTGGGGLGGVPGGGGTFNVVLLLSLGLWAMRVRR